MKSGYVSIIGKPNTGKSTLLNVILKQKLSAVTHKAQTTRSRVLGIYIDEESQIIFYDTPGILKAKNTMEKYMINDIQNSVKDADIIVLMVDNINYKDNYSYLLNKKKTNFLLINKIDRIEQEETDKIIEFYKEKDFFNEIIPLSAIENVNIDMFINKLKNYLPYNHLFYPQDIITDKPEKFFVAEFLREQLFLLYGAEIPYSAGIIIEEFKERDKGKTYIKIFIYLERDSQKGIIIGEKGRMIKKLGINARKIIEDFLDRPVFIEIKVKVKRNWKNDTILLNRMWRV